MAACILGIKSMNTKYEARSSQSNSTSLVYCEATLEVCLTFHAVEKFHYKNLHFVLFSSFFISHNSSTKARKNTKKTPKFSILHKDVPFDT